MTARPTGTPELISSFAEGDARFIPILLGENSPGGVATAANAGLDRATGEWVGFVDGDDFIEPTMFESLVKAATSHHADLAMCQYREVTADGLESRDPADVRRWKQLSPGRTLPGRHRDQAIPAVRRRTLAQALPSVLVGGQRDSLPDGETTSTRTTRSTGSPSFRRGPSRWCHRCSTTTASADRARPWRPPTPGCSRSSPTTPPSELGCRSGNCSTPTRCRCWNGSSRRLSGSRCGRRRSSAASCSTCCSRSSRSTPRRCSRGR